MLCACGSLSCFRLAQPLIEGALREESYEVFILAYISFGVKKNDTPNFEVSAHLAS